MKSRWRRSDSREEAVALTGSALGCKVGVEGKNTISAWNAVPVVGEVSRPGFRARGGLDCIRVCGYLHHQPSQ